VGIAQRTCAYDRHRTSWMNVPADRADFKTCWQGVTDDEKTPFVNSWWNVIEACVRERHAEVLCVRAVDEVA